jgi:hypothetical protein
MTGRLVQIARWRKGKQLAGQIVDAWQVTLADVGPTGLDKRGGGKLLLLEVGDLPLLFLWWLRVQLFQLLLHHHFLLLLG